ncbi:MAG: DUF1844 domain-containing protein [Ignavibacteria bacterium]|nr:DUF1844 domain-containing protein [Ignavibacteria bacterium]
MTEDKNKQIFLSLIYSFQMQTMMQLGKLTNPVTNKTETDLEGAQMTIDMLDMLKEKTKNNISGDESRFLDQVIADLKLNFVEEKDKINSGKKTEIKDDQITDDTKTADDSNKDKDTDGIGEEIPH